MYSFYPKIVFRAPAFSIDCLNAGPQHPALDHAYFENALYLASTALYYEYERYRLSGAKDVKSGKKLFYSLHKYINRMSTRCTPFGMFSGIATADWGAHTEILLNGKNRLHTRLDNAVSYRLFRFMMQQPGISEKVKYYPNNTLYVAGSEVRYIEYKYVQQNERIHSITAVDDSEYLQKVLLAAKNGGTVKTLAACLTDDDITIEESTAFITELIDAQVLLSELEPSVSGQEYFDHLLEVVASLGDHSLQHIRQHIYDIDNGPVPLPVTAYRQILSEIRSLDIDMSEQNLFQADLVLGTDKAMLDTALQETLQDALLALNKLTIPLRPTDLERFKDAFEGKYEKEEIPLLLALDSDIGIDYLTGIASDPAPLIDDIRFKNNNTLEFKWDKIKDMLLQKHTAALKNNQYTIHITPTDLEDLEANWNDLPPTMHCVFRVTDKVTNTIKIDHLGGSSGVNLIGRFAHHDEQILGIAREIAVLEAQSHADKIIAEIVHLPDGRVGNILLRPQCRQYEIPVLTSSTLPQTQQVTLDDLYLSIRNNRLVLRSKRLNKEVIPRHSTAYNFGRSAIRVYKFLCDLQTQNMRANLMVNPGDLASRFIFTPRIQYKNAILSPARWHFNKSHINDLSSMKTWAGFRDEWQLPRFIALEDGDNELLTDLENPESVALLQETIRKRPSVKLVEVFIEESGPVICNQQGKYYCNQFIAFLLKEKKTIQETTNAATALPDQVRYSIKEPVKRKLAAGSDWLYFKIYCGHKTADKLLITEIQPFIRQLRTQAFIHQWFFIRYTDPDMHIRLRLQLTDTRYTGNIIQVFHDRFQVLVEKRLVWKTQIDTYERELERYGEVLIEQAESIFYHDSEFTVAMLTEIAGQNNNDMQRWLSCIAAIDRLLRNFGIAIADRFAMMEAISHDFNNEFQVNKTIKEQISHKYRHYSAHISNILQEDQAGATHTRLYQLLEERGRHIRPCAAHIKRCVQMQACDTSLESMLKSYIHMSANRFFISRPRKHEMVIYNLMAKYYRSAIALQKKSPINV